MHISLRRFQPIRDLELLLSRLYIHIFSQTGVNLVSRAARTSPSKNSPSVATVAPTLSI